MREERDHPRTPAAVRGWIAAPPPRLSIATEPATEIDTRLAKLDDGERAAIALAIQHHTPLLLMDDRAGVAAARAIGIAAAGTLGLLHRAAQRGLVDLPVALARLRRTNFHIRQELFDALLAGSGRKIGRPE